MHENPALERVPPTPRGVTTLLTDHLACGDNAATRKEGESGRLTQKDCHPRHRTLHQTEVRTVSLQIQSSLRTVSGCWLRNPYFLVLVILARDYSQFFADLGLNKCLQADSATLNESVVTFEIWHFVWNYTHCISYLIVVLDMG